MIARVDIEKLDRIFPKAYFDIAGGCAEPGYDDKPVILADWNNVPEIVLYKLEALGYDCEWSDEWIACDSCRRVIRSSPDSYHWQMSGIIDEDGCTCLDCLDAASYFESIENQPRKALTWPIFERYDPADYGYQLIEASYENGWYEGQTDDPQFILETAQAHDPNGRFLFAMTDQGQFDVKFSLYKKVEV